MTGKIVTEFGEQGPKETVKSANHRLKRIVCVSKKRLEGLVSSTRLPGKVKLGDG